MDELLKNGLYIIATFFIAGLVIILISKIFAENMAKLFMTSMENKFNKELEEYKKELESKNAKAMLEHNLLLENIYNKDLEVFKSEIEDRKFNNISEDNIKQENKSDREVSSYGFEVDRKNLVLEAKFNTELELYRNISELLFNIVENINVYVNGIVIKMENIHDDQIMKYITATRELKALVNKNRFIINKEILTLLDEYVEQESKFTYTMLDADSFNRGKYVFKAQVQLIDDGETELLEEMRKNINALRLKICEEMRRVIDKY